MAKNQNVKLRPGELDSDITAYNALKGFGDYSPLNGTYKTGQVTIAYEAMLEARTLEDQRDGEFKAARDARVQKEWDFHNLILGAKEQVVAQYGKSSDQIQAMGLKKKTEYKKASGRAKKS